MADNYYYLLLHHKVFDNISVIKIWYNKKSIVIVPTTSLVEQMQKDFKDYGYDKDICKIYSGQPVFDSEITITTWQSFSKAAPKDVMQSFDVVVGDEAHLFKATTLKGILEKMKDTAIRIGTTGTLDAQKFIDCNLKDYLVLLRK